MRTSPAVRRSSGRSLANQSQVLPGEIAAVEPVRPQEPRLRLDPELIEQLSQINAAPAYVGDPARRHGRLQRTAAALMHRLHDRFGRAFRSSRLKVHVRPTSPSMMSDQLAGSTRGMPRCARTKRSSVAVMGSVVSCGASFMRRTPVAGSIGGRAGTDERGMAVGSWKATDLPKLGHHACAATRTVA